MKKLFVFLIKYIPVIQMAGIIVNNIVYSLTNSLYPEILDFTIGNSLVTTLLLYICSNLFGFCKWHRLIITANLINIIIATTDFIIPLDKTNFQLILFYFTIDIIFIMLIIINKFK